MQGTPAQEAAPSAEETQKEIVYPLPAGLTAEELARIKCVAVIGEHFGYYKTEEFNAFQRMGDAGEDIAYQLANESGEGDRRWYWNGDGSEVTMTPYDLRFLSMMPHLEEIHLVNVRVTDAPDLSGVPTMKGKLICAATRIIPRSETVRNCRSRSWSWRREEQRISLPSPLRICWTLVWMQRETGTLPTCCRLQAAQIR